MTVYQLHILKGLTVKFESGDNQAFLAELPPVAERPNPDTVAALPRWQMTLPGQHLLWARYTILPCSLADFPGVPPAKKHFPEATHEISVFAIDPNFSQEAFEAGGIAILEPVNYVKQIVSTDERCKRICERLAFLFVQGRLPAEPTGITDARRLFDDKVDSFNANLYEVAFHDVGGSIELAAILKIAAERVGRRPGAQADDRTAEQR